MISPVRNIARSASSQKSLNILLFITDGYFENRLCEACPEHRFYGPVKDSNQPNGWNFNLYPQPDNFYFVPNFANSTITTKIDFDLIICHDRTSQYDIAKQLANILHINIIIMEHIANTAVVDIISIIPLLQKTKQNLNIFFNEQVANNFKLDGTTINLGIPDIYSTQNNKQILIPEEQAPLLTNTNINNYTTYTTTNLTTPQYHSLFQKAQFYFNLQADPAKLPLDLLHAMSAGCVVISVSSPVLENIIKHMETGIIVKNTNDLAQIWNSLTSQDKQRIAQNANQYITKNHNLSTFQQKWQRILTTAAQQTYTR